MRNTESTSKRENKSFQTQLQTNLIQIHQTNLSLYG